MDYLSTAERWVPAAVPLVVVSPHPDDEVFGAGGLIREWRRRGHPVTIVSVTDGEAAYSNWPGLGRVRRRELREALSMLCGQRDGNSIGVVRAGIRDGAVMVERDKLRTVLNGLVTARPTLVAPYEGDGHPDHEASGLTCLALAREHGLAVVRYPIWAWHHSQPGDFRAARWGRFDLDLPAQVAKADAMECFFSQLLPYRREPIVPDHVTTYFARPFEAFLL